MTESQLQEAVAEYLVRVHPSVMFHSDFGSGTKLTKFQAIRQMRQNGGRKGWPDLFIAEPKDGYAGLFLELKKDGTRLRKKNGDWSSKHIEEQVDVLDGLEFRGYKAELAVGFDEAIEKIENYLKGGNYQVKKQMESR